MGDPIRLLHVDDEPALAELTATFLERKNADISVETAPNADVALERIDEGFDCIVSDYDMPGLNGIELLRSVREIDEELPFILFTGKGSEEIASDAISAGVTDYLQKESGTGQYTVLANRVKNAVEQYRSKRALESSQQRLSLLFDRSPLGAIEWNDSFEFVRLNDAAEAILGYSDAELRGRSWELIVPESDRESVAEVLSDLLDTRGGYRSVNENVRADGERIVCEWHNRVITEDDGDVVTIISKFQDVTARRENRRRLEATIDNLPGMVYRHRNEPEWPLELVMGACEELTGYAASELLSDVGLAEEIVHPDDREYVRTETEAGIDERGEYELVYRIVRKGGTVRWVWERGQLVHAPIAERELLEGLLIDITELKEDELELDRTNTVLSTLLENLPVGVLVEDESREIRTVNSTLLDLFGVDAEPETLGGRDCARAAEEMKSAFADPEAFLEAIESGLEANEPVTGTELELADGRLLELDSIPYELADGRANLWVYSDVAERIEQQRQLEERTLQLEGVLDSVEAPIWLRDADSRFLLINQPYRERFGIDPDTEVVGKRPPDLLPDELASRFLENDRRVLETEAPVELEEEMDTENGRRTYLTRITPLFDEDGEIYGTCGIASDLTDHEHRERQNDRLEAFASMISHDLRNPLRVVDGRVELAREECDSDHLDAAADALERSHALIDDLLALAQEGDSIRDLATVDLAAVVDDCRRNVELADATLVTTTDRTVRADRSRLQQLLENLVRNSVEHGGGGVTITVGDLEGGFYVADDGRGIPADDRERIFETGYTTRETGTGLGLSIATEIADAHGWRITATESASGGARFEITCVEPEPG